MAVFGVAGAVAVGGAQAAGRAPGRTHFVIDESDVEAVREIRAAAAARVAERREELAVLEAELAVLDEALEENEREAEGPHDAGAALEENEREAEGGAMTEGGRGDGA